MTHKTQLISLIAASLIAGTGCLELKDEALGIDRQELSYDESTDQFYDSFNGSVWAGNKRIKVYTHRVQEGTTYKTTIQRRSGSHTDFKVYFTATKVEDWSNDLSSEWSSATHCTNHGSGPNKPSTCSVTVPAGQQYAYVLVRAYHDSNAAHFTLKRWWSTYCPEESCYQRHEFFLDNLSQTKTKPKLNGAEPTALDGQTVTVTIYRSNHDNVMVDDGVKLKDLSGNAIWQTVLCAGEDEADWSNNVATCNFQVAQDDRRVHVPVKLEPNTSSTGRNVCVVIEREGPYVTTQDGGSVCP